MAYTPNAFAYDERFQKYGRYGDVADGGDLTRVNIVEKVEK